MFELRRFEEADAASVWRLHDEGLRQMNAHMGDGPWDDDLRSVRATYLADAGEFLVATVEGEVVAMGALRRVSDTIGEIKRMRVDAHFQRRGFGRALLGALEVRARELGYRWLRLDTTTKQLPARRLYESSGYLETTRDLDAAGQETILFEKELTELDCAWLRAELIRTARLSLEPLRVAHAEEISRLLDDARLHEYIGGHPDTTEQLNRRYARLVAGRSPDGRQGWLNWIIRLRDCASAVGTVQATLEVTAGQLGAEIAWIIGSRYQRRGYAKEAAAGMVGWLRKEGIGVFVAHVHPDHAASVAVAESLGLRATEVSVEGETRWVRSEP